MPEEKKDPVTPVKPVATAPAAMSAEHPLLTEAEVATAKENARKKLVAESKKKAMAAIEEAEKHRLAIEEGLTTGNASNDEVVSLTLDLAPHSDCLRINGMQYFHNCLYSVPRHMAQSMLEQQHRGWLHQAQIDGKPGREAYKPRDTLIKGFSSVANAPQRFA